MYTTPILILRYYGNYITRHTNSKISWNYVNYRLIIHIFEPVDNTTKV